MKWKTLLPAGLLAASFFTVVYRYEKQSSVDATKIERDAKNATADGQQAQPADAHAVQYKAQQRALATSKDAIRPDPVLRQFAEDQRGQLWDGVKLGAIAHTLSSKEEVGADARFDLGDKKFEGKVFFHIQDEGGAETIGLTLAEPKGSLYAKIFPDGRVTGNLSYQKELSTYEIKGTRDQVVLYRRTLPESVCSRVDAKGAVVGLEPNVSGAPLQPLVPNPGTPLVVPILNSNPAAEAVLFLDFSTTKVTGTRWNLEFGAPEIQVTKPYYTQDQIIKMFDQIADDYAPFRINVTTDRAKFNAAPVGKRTRAIFTYENQWFTDFYESIGEDGSGVVGVAYPNTFNNGTDTPHWVFCEKNDQFSLDGLMVTDPIERQLAIEDREANNLAATVSHEAGHTFGLEHDGYGPFEYYPGDGIWGPIMGNPFSTPIVQWSNGDYSPFSTDKTDDFATIAGGANAIGFRLDDHGDSLGQPSQLRGAVGMPPGTVETTGVINSRGEKDVFRFTSAGGQIHLQATPYPTEEWPTMTGEDDMIVGNTACEITLRDGSGNVIEQTVDPAGVTAEIVRNNLPAGLYYVEIKGVGENDLTTFSDYGSRGNYHIHGFVNGLNGAVARITEPSLSQVSIVEGNGLILNGEILNPANNMAIQWVMASGPGVVDFNTPNQIATRAKFSTAGTYVLECRITSNGMTNATSLTVSVEAAGSTPQFANRGPDITLTVPATITGQFFANLGAATADDGVPANQGINASWQLLSGNGSIETSSAANTRLLFNQGGTFQVLHSASDSQIRTFKDAQVLALVRRATYVNKGTDAKVYIPTSAAVDGTWYAQAFNDSGASWIPGKVGAGFFNKSTDKYSFRQRYIGSTSFDLASQMVNKATSAYVRIPFNVTDKANVFNARLDMIYDDGVIIYLNGTEIKRRNFGANATPTWQSTAAIERKPEDLLLPATLAEGQTLMNLLQEGNNVLAIQGMNKAIGDDDLIILPTVLLDSNIGGFQATMQQGEITDVNSAQPAPDQDADGDGVSNFLEYASGTNPYTKDQPRPVTYKDGKVSFTLPTAIDPGLACFVESSSNLKDWTTVVSRQGAGEWTGAVNAITSRSVTEGQLYEIDLGHSEESRFYRIRFEELPR